MPALLDEGQPNIIGAVGVLQFQVWKSKAPNVGLHGAIVLIKDQLAAITKLVRRFERVSKTQRRAHQEAEVRTNFIDPLFAAIGWPMDDRAHVERETTVAEGKRPDYIFKLHGVPRLFLEAKPFREDARSRDYARDAITKAYNKGVPWAGVTNFTDLVIFDAYEELGRGKEPRRVLDLTFGDYSRPDCGLHLLTPDGLDKRLLDQRAVVTGVRRRPVPIEKRLYESMRSWREKLFNDMAQYLDWRSDEQLSQGDEAIQRLIDRLIFLRNCEDRGISEQDLRALRHRIRDRSERNVRVTASLLRLFSNAAATYDSEIFQTDALIDVLFRGLAGGTGLDDTLAQVIEGLYSVPKSYAEYDFAQMEPDVLGQVYEQYLGYVPQRVRRRTAQLSLPDMPSQEIAIEAKGQRRKKHGIYYTPSWVVQYIVQNTVGRFLEENRDRPDVIDNVTILDPACGSGSFLIRAYETLLQHHAAQMGGEIGDLDRPLRERILRRNIYGVDIDPQAIEIARLNLLIRMVRQQELLPELKDNIRLGNSLVSGNASQLRKYFGESWRDKRPFNWEREFPDIMNSGGFDIVIGNPPYVKEYVDRQLFHDVRGSQLSQYYQGKSDIWYTFACLAIDLLKPGGLHSFIATNNWITNSGASLLRRKIITETRLAEFVDFRDYKVFEAAGIQTMIYLLEKTGGTHHGEVRYKAITRPDIAALDVSGFLFEGNSGDFAVSFDAALDAGSEGQPFTFVELRDADILSHMQSMGTYRLKSKDVKTGIDVHQDFVAAKHLPDLQADDVQPGDGIFILSSKEKRSLGLTKKEQNVVKPYYTTEELGRYYGSPDNHSWIIYTDSALVPRIDEYPHIKAHLVWFAPVITCDNRPYGLHRARDESFFLGEKLVSLRKTDRPHFTYTDFPCYVSQTFNVVKPSGINLKYLAAILNSRVCHFWLAKRGKRQGEALQVDQAPLLKIPIRDIDFKVAREVKVHDRLVALVDIMLDLHERLAAKGDLQDTARERIERDITTTDREIDTLVYDLYDLADKERGLIEAEVLR